MGEQKQTTAIPGPWVAELDAVQSDADRGLAVIAVVPEVHRNGFTTPTRGMVAWVHSGIGACETDEQAVATARLIAAAPDMLKALKDAEGHLEEMRQDRRWHPIEHCPVLDQVRRVIAAAEGKSA